MRDRRIADKNRFWLFLLLPALLSCGGGAGEGGPPADFPLIAVDENAPTATINASIATTDGEPFGTLMLLDSALLEIELRNSRGRAIAEAVLTLEGENVTPEFHSVQTDREGMAIVKLLATPEHMPGPATVTIVYGEGGQGDDNAVEEQVFLTLSEADLELGYLADGVFVPGEIAVTSPVLPAEATTTLQFAVRDRSGELITQAIPINLSSPCAAADPPLATLSTAIETSQGLASASYTADGCQGQDILTADLKPISSAQATAHITLTNERIPTIEFSSLSVEQISLRGTGDAGRPESAQVTFTLTSSDGDPVFDFLVEFALTSTAGGLTLSSDQARTDSQGTASTTVQAGSYTARTQVRASISVGENRYSVLSDELLVTSGLPDQDSFSLSADRLNVAGAEIDGLNIELTARLADHFNNPVPDGTLVRFATEYGAVEALCQTLNGVCQVEWTSQEPRSSLGFADLIPTIDTVRCSTYQDFGPCPEVLHKFQGGRSTVLASTRGEESFVDANGNGRFDAGERFSDLPEAFIDHNEDGRYNPATDFCASLPSPGCASGAEESFIDNDHDGEYSQGNDLYNGSLCPRELDGLDCSRELVSLSKSIVLVSSSANQRLAVVDEQRRRLAQDAAFTPGKYTLYIADLFNNPPATGTTVTIESANCSMSPGTPFTRTNTSVPGAWALAVEMNESTNQQTNEGDVIITITMVDGGVVEFIRDCKNR